MPISVEEFKKARERPSPTDILVLKFLCVHRNKAFSLEEIVEKKVLVDFTDFGRLVRGRFVDFKRIDDIAYFAISEKGIKYVE